MAQEWNRVIVVEWRQSYVSLHYRHLDVSLHAVRVTQSLACGLSRDAALIKQVDYGAHQADYGAHQADYAPSAASSSMSLRHLPMPMVLPSSRSVKRPSCGEEEGSRRFEKATCQ